eukprot:gene24854-33341_t
MESRPLFYKGQSFPSSLSLNWRIFHWITYIIGGLTFTVGSYQYFPSVSNFVLGGWLFTIGSLGFAIADFNEWWKNNRVGCFYYEDFEDSFERTSCTTFDAADTFKGKFQRAEVGLNFFLSWTGSTLYLIGSIFFIPSLNALVTGTYIFIVGSAVIFTAQMWKLTRSMYNIKENSYQFANVLEDTPGAIVDATAGFGGLCYLVGSVIFLPEYDLSDAETFQAAAWFQVGGCLYLLSGIALGYRYFFTQNYPH